MSHLFDKYVFFSSEDMFIEERKGEGEKVSISRFLPCVGIALTTFRCMG